MRQLYYFSEKIRKRMDGILHYPLSVIDAGSGYGKTTAVKEYFLKQRAVGYRQLMYTCFGEPAAASWKGICQEIEHIDTQTGQYLSSLKIPSIEVLGEIAHQMNYLCCDRDTILCIDNFQLFDIEEKEKLIEALAQHRCANLHILIITQPLKHDITGFSNYRISAREFILDLQDIKNLFLQYGQSLSNLELEQLYTTTGGYMAALRLQLDSQLYTRHLEPVTSISSLMDLVLWRHLQTDEQECILCLSVLGSFSLREGGLVCGWEQEALSKFLKRIDFISFDNTSKTYLFHHLLLTYLKEKFDCLPNSRQYNLWKQAANAEKEADNPLNAAKYFAKCDDFVSILKLPLKSDDRVELVQMENGLIVELLIRPEHRKYLTINPELILTLTLELFIQGKMILFSQYLEQAKTLLDTVDDYPVDRKNRLLGEYALMESFFHFNDIVKMCFCHRRAYQYLNGPTSLYSLNTAWTFGIPSIVCMFWRVSGELRKELSQVTAGLPIYHKLSCGNGLGAAEAMAGEIALLSGQDISAMEYFQEALFKAESMEQDSICYCAYLGMAKIALLRGQVSTYVHMQENIEDRAYLGKEIRNVYTTGICKGYLYMLLGQFEEIPEWLGRKEGISSRSLAIALPFAHMIYAGILLKQTREHKVSHEKFMVEMQQLILESRQMNMLLPQLYYHIYKAIELDRNGDRREAGVIMEKAMQMAEPDQIYFPFAEHFTQIKPILDSLVLNETLRDFRKTAGALGMRYEKGRTVILEAMRVKKVKLTPRELEIAGLLKERYSIKEIAEKLSISPSTVSNTMQSIYAKLGVHSKRELYYRTDI